MGVSDPVRFFMYVFLDLSYMEDLLFGSICSGTQMKIKIKCKTTG